MKTATDPGLSMTGTKPRLRTWLEAFSVMGLCTIVAWGLHEYVASTDLAMTYLVGVVIVAFRSPMAVSLFAAAMSIAVFDFFFVPPFLTFAVADARYLITFAVMAAASVVVTSLMARIKREVQRADERERRAAALYALTRALANVRSPQRILEVAAEELLRAFAVSWVELRDETDTAHVCHAQAGTTPSATMQRDTFVLSAGDHQLGELAVVWCTDADGEGLRGEWLATFVDQISVALALEHLATQHRAATLKLETERLRASLLSSVSHDLRTPLATIMGSSSILSDADDEIAATLVRDLGTSIHEEAEHLARLLQNLLEITRIEGGALRLNHEWHVPEEIIGSALHRLRRQLTDFTVKVDATTELVFLDATLVELVLVNLVENAVKHGSEGRHVSITAVRHDQAMRFSVADRGVGVPELDVARVFDKFYRAASAAAVGTGLGLSIARAIVEAHGGTIALGSRGDGLAGTEVTFDIPIPDPPPSVDGESRDPLDLTREVAP